MQKVLVVGLGEVGYPLYEIIKESEKFKVYGYDVDAKKKQRLNQPWTLPDKFDVLHICLPCKDDVQFCQIVLDYVYKYKPKLLIINSTVTPHTTSTIAKYVDCLVVHSPVRGMHKRMKEDMKLYVKYVGPITSEAGKAAEDHFKKIGLKVKVLGKAVETELGKLFETSYTALQIAAWQEMHRIAMGFGADIDNVADMIDDTECKKYVQVGPVWFPSVMCGHCLIPNIHLLLECYNSKLFAEVLVSNDKRKMELKNAYAPAREKTKEGIEKLKKRVKKNARKLKYGKSYVSEGDLPSPESA